MIFFLRDRLALVLGTYLFIPDLFDELNELLGCGSISLVEVAVEREGIVVGVGEENSEMRRGSIGMSQQLSDVFVEVLQGYLLL